MDGRSNVMVQWMKQQLSGILKYMCWIIFLIASSGYSHLPSSFRQTSLLSTALTMTSRDSPALTGSSFPLHFLLVSVGLMVTWYNTCISPSYWERVKITSCEYEKKTDLKFLPAQNNVWMNLEKWYWYCFIQIREQQFCFSTTELLNMLKDIMERQTLNFFLNSFSSFSSFFCFFGSISSLFLPLKVGRLERKKQQLNEISKGSVVNANLGSKLLRIIVRWSCFKVDVIVPAERRKRRHILRINIIVDFLINCWVIWGTWEKSVMWSFKLWYLT